MFALAGLLFYFVEITAQPLQQPDTVPGDIITRDNYFPILPVPDIVENENGMRAGLLYDCTTKKIVWEKDLHYAYPIASLTKMMVALLTVEDVLNCKVDWDDEIEMTRVLVKRVKRRKVRYTVKETYTLDALFRLAMIASHNEACNLIAKHLNGSVDDFVARMNIRARELSMNNTYYSNPSGLPAGKSALDNSSTANDYLILALECLKYSEIVNITKIGYADVANNKNSGIFRNHNRLVIDYENEVDGLKTGYTRNARFCLVATSTKSNRRLISIVIGSRSTYERNEIVGDMMSNYYQYLGIGRLGKTWEETLALKSVQDSLKNDSTLTASSDNTVTPPVIVYKTVWTKEKKIHHVRGGETLSGIADKYHCTVSSIRKWNRLRSTRVLKGQKLIVFTNVKKKVAVREEMIEKGDSDEEQQEEKLNQKKTDPSNNNNSSQSVSSINEAGYILYTVQRGDTLWNIAKKYQGVTVEQIKKDNNLTSSQLKAGTKLKIVVNG